MLDQFGRAEEPAAAERIAWTCALAPGAVKEWDEPVKLAELAFRNGPDEMRHGDATGLGAVLYRAGRFVDAVECLQRANAAWQEAAVKPTYSSPAYAWLFLAMAHHRQGHAEEARRCLQDGTALADRELQTPVSWNRKLTLELLRGEATAMLGPAEKK
jgi:tetratricopeptide (TPR) repeat protein